MRRAKVLAPFTQTSKVIAAEAFSIRKARRGETSSSSNREYSRASFNTGLDARKYLPIAFAAFLNDISLVRFSVAPYTLQISSFLIVLRFCFVLQCKRTVLQ